MRKTIITIIVMFALVISIATADKDGTSNLPVVGTQAGYIGPMKIIPLDQNEVKTIAEEHPDLISKRYIPAYVKEEIVEEKLKLSEEEEKIREKILEAKTRINEIKNSKLQTSREEKIVTVSAYLSNTIQLMIIKLSMLESDIYKSGFINDKEASRIISWINSKKVELQTIREKVSYFNSQTSKSKILSSVEEIKDTWEKSKEGIKKYSQDLANSKVEHNLAKLNLAKTPLNTVVKELERDGQDITKLSKMHKEYSKDLESASIHLEKAKELTVQKNYEDAKEEYNIAKKELLEGTKKLSKLTSELSEVEPFQLEIKEAISITERQSNIKPTTILPPYAIDHQAEESAEQDSKFNEQSISDSNEKEPQETINNQPEMINQLKKENSRTTKQVDAQSTAGI